MSEKYYYHSLNHGYKLRVEKNEKNMMFARVDIISPSGKAVKIYNVDGYNGDNYAPPQIFRSEAYIKSIHGAITFRDLIDYPTVSNIFLKTQNKFLIENFASVFEWIAIQFLDAGNGKCEMAVEDFLLHPLCNTIENLAAPTGQPSKPVVKFLLRFERQNLVTKQYEQVSHMFDCEEDAKAYVHENYLPSWKNIQLHEVVNTREVAVERMVKFDRS
jgi:hypothetical protein